MVLVVPATERDVPALRALGVRTWRATYEGVLPGAAVERGIDELFNLYSLGAAVRDGRMLAASRDGIIVGLLEFDRVDDARTMVWKLYVDPDAQGRGIGGLLLERLLQAATTPEVRVEHDERNVAAGVLRRVRLRRGRGRRGGRRRPPGAPRPPPQPARCVSMISRRQAFTTSGR